MLWHGVGIPYDLSPEQLTRMAAATAHRTSAAVRDPLSAKRLAASGYSGDIDIVPDSGLLIDRVLPRKVLDARLADLRARGQYPRRPALVLQGCDLLVPDAEAIAGVVARCQEDADAEIVLVETGRCRADGEFADAVSRALEVRLGRRPYRLPGTAPLEDVAAALAGAAVVVGSSLHAAVTAVAFERPFVTMNFGRESKLDGFGLQTGLAKHVIHEVGDLGGALTAALTSPPSPARVFALRHQLDRHFDGLAGAVKESVASTHRRLVVLHDDEVLRGRLDDAAGRAQQAEAERDAILATRTFRATASARRRYGQLRAHFGR